MLNIIETCERTEAVARLLILLSSRMSEKCVWIDKENVQCVCGVPRVSRLDSQRDSAGQLIVVWSDIDRL